MTDAPPTVEERSHVERALAETRAAREALLVGFSARDGLALAVMLHEAGRAYTDVVRPPNVSSEAFRAGQPLRLRYDSLQWMFDTLVRVTLDRRG
jgi:hypothetical protein